MSILQGTVTGSQVTINVYDQNDNLVNNETAMVRHGALMDCNVGNVTSDAIVDSFCKIVCSKLPIANATDCVNCEKNLGDRCRVSYTYKPTYLLQ